METVKKLSNEELGMLWRKHQEMISRIEKGQIDFKDSADAFQQIIIENRSGDFLKVVRNERIIANLEHPWREENGIVYFSVTSDGTTGAQWIERLAKKGHDIETEAKRILLSEDFKPTTGVTTKIGVFKNSFFSKNTLLNTSLIRKVASMREFVELNHETACLMCEMFTETELEGMGLNWIVVMHQAFNPVGLKCRQLYIQATNGVIIKSVDAAPERFWSSDGSYAFAAPNI